MGFYNRICMSFAGDNQFKCSLMSKLIGPSKTVQKKTYYECVVNIEASIALWLGSPTREG